MRDSSNAAAYGVERLEGRTLLSGGLAGASAVSFAFDDAGALHVAYYDVASRNLKYATRSAGGAWGAAVTVDAHRQAGVQVSLAINANGQPAIAYYDATNHNLKFAQPGKHGWAVSTVDAKGDPGRNPSLAFDPSGYAMISYYAATKQDLRLALLARGKWRVSTIDAAGAAGRFSSIAINPTDGSWGIAYEGAGGKQVRYATDQGGATTTAVVDTLTGTMEVPSLAFDASGKPAASYVDGANALVLSRLGGGGWAKTVTGSTATGGYSTLQFDARTGSPEIAFASGAGQVSVAGLGTSAWSSRAVGNGLPAAAADPNTHLLGLIINGNLAEPDPMLASPAGFTAQLSIDNYPGIDLAWTDNSSIETGYRVERSTDGVHFSMIDILAADATSDTDMLAADPETTYSYRVVPFDAAGDGTPSAVQAITTWVSPPTNLAASVASAGEVDLTWTNVSTHIPYLQLYCMANTTNFLIDGNVSSAATSYHVTQLADGTPLSAGTDYTFYAQEGGLAQSQGSNPAYATTGFASPYTLDPIASTPTQITMAWGAVLGATGYELQWAPNWTDFVTVTTTAADVTQYTISGLPEATQKYFRVRALNPLGDSAYLWYSQGDTSLNAPTNLTATALPGGQIRLEWTDNSSMESSYNVQVGAGNGPFDPAITLPADSTSCVISSFGGAALEAGRPYRFSVQAVGGNFASDAVLVGGVRAVA